MTAYDRDFHGWAYAQAEALRRRSANEIDWENVAEEIESLGKGEQSELESRLAVLVTHLLKWAYQAERRGRSWENTIREQRRQIAKHIQRNPSLKPLLLDAFDSAYETARGEISSMLDQPLDAIPAKPVFDWDEALTPNWMPEQLSFERSPR